MKVVQFNGKEYSVEAIQKQIVMAHKEEVITKEIQPSLHPESPKAIAIKFNNQYHLLVGQVVTDREKVTLHCITKHALKRCEVVESVEEEIPVSRPFAPPRGSYQRTVRKDGRSAPEQREHHARPPRSNDDRPRSSGNTFAKNR